MLKPFHNEAQIVVAEGQTLRLVLNFSTIDLMESLLGHPMDELLGQIMAPQPSHSLMAKFIWAMTREHHSELTLDHIAAFMYSKEYGAAAGTLIGDLVKRAFNINFGEGEESPRPPKRPRGTSGHSSKRGLKREPAL
jgi:hypothetical protein